MSLQPRRKPIKAKPILHAYIKADGVLKEVATSEQDITIKEFREELKKQNIKADIVSRVISVYAEKPKQAEI